MSYDFYAFLDRMKYIKRWSLMRSVREENIMEHSQEVALIAHALAVINNKYCGGNADGGKCVLYAVYHECSEVVTGDLPTPIKYFNSSINGAYKDLEGLACDRLLTMLPEEMKEDIAEYVKPDTQSIEWKLVKAADRFSAYIKCLEEKRCGNTEFEKARKSIEEDLMGRKMPEVTKFFELFIGGYEKTLDELDTPLD
ncbi:MAG: 5'-deoxynucleotidase [Clostridia bacterium]|nr:5'-deoxynucleotidase [Clostridia bacterium]